MNFSVNNYHISEEDSSERKKACCLFPLSGDICYIIVLSRNRAFNLISSANVATEPFAKRFETNHDWPIFSYFNAFFFSISHQRHKIIVFRSQEYNCCLTANHKQSWQIILSINFRSPWKYGDDMIWLSKVLKLFGLVMCCETFFSHDCLKD